MSTTTLSFPQTGTGGFNLTPEQLALLGLGGVAGGVPTPTNSTTASSGNSFSTGVTSLQSLLNTLSNLSSSGTTTTTPTLSPESQAFINNLIGKYTQLGNVNLKPYQAQQSAAINKSANLQSQAAQNIMAARGLATSPVAATTAANIDAGRFGAQTNLNQSIPLLQNQLQLQNLGGAASLAGILPRGSVSTQQQQQTGQTSQTGNTTSTTNQNNQFSQNSQTSQQAGGGIGGLAGGLGAILASLWL